MNVWSPSILPSSPVNTMANIMPSASDKSKIYVHGVWSQACLLHSTLFLKHTPSTSYRPYLTTTDYTSMSCLCFQCNWHSTAWSHGQKLTKCNGKVQNVEISRAQHSMYSTKSHIGKQIFPPSYLTSPGTLKQSRFGLPQACLPPNHTHIHT